MPMDLALHMFYSNPTGCTIFFFHEKFLALHISDVTCVHRQEHNCSVQPQAFLLSVEDGSFSIKWCGGLFYVDFVCTRFSISSGIYVLVCVS
jgi:hypothetical protein